MDPETGPPANEVTRLQRCINDLVSVLAFPAMWSGGNPGQIISFFVDGLLRVLRLDLVYVRLTDPSGGPSEWLRIPDIPHSEATLTGQTLAALGNDPAEWPRQMRLDAGGATFSIVPLRLGLQPGLGLVAAGSRRVDFPLLTENLLLSVATNQLVMGLQEAQLRVAQQRVTQELDERVAQRTAQLHATERELDQIVNTIPAMVWSTRADGVAEFFSQHYLAYVGLPAAQLQGWGWTTVVHPEDLGPLITNWHSIMAAGKPGESEMRLRRYDGEYRWFLMRATPMLDDSGAVMKWYGINTDIDDRRRAEEALSKARTELANAARTMSLGVLTAAIAHEVNQPLSGIINNAGTCLRMLSGQTPNIDGALETVRRTMRDGKRAAEVIARLRTLYIRRDLQPEPMDLNEATQEVVALSLTELQQDRVVVRHELADDLPPVKGDRIQLQQVILNLLRNASDAMRTIEDRPRELVIKTESDDANTVRLSVSDAGVGFPPLAVERIFEPFYTTKRDGMGIGLSVSRTIIEAHQGRLWAIPNDGPGVTFAFSLPRQPSTEPA